MPYEKAIRTPIPGGCMGYMSIGKEELAVATELLTQPEKLWRYRENSYTTRFEQEACALTGAKHALFVNSGTSALSCCLAALAIGPGDEVIVSAYTYIATASACIEVGAVPIPCEIDESLGLDPEAVEKRITPYTKAVILTHMQGVPGRVDAVRAVAKKHGLYMIEDCCQAIGARYHGKYCGAESDAFAWSLNYFKNITCGEGGCFFTSDDDAYARGYYQSDPAGVMWGNGIGDGSSVPYFTRAGYRASELCGGVAWAQLQKLGGNLAVTRALKKSLLAQLNGPKHYQLQFVDDPEGDCGVSFAVIANSKEECKALTEALAKEGLTVGSAYSAAFPDRHIFTYWEGVVKHQGATPKNYPWNDPAYHGTADYSADACPRTLDILSRSLRLSLNQAMSEQNIREIAEAFNRADASF